MKKNIIFIISFSAAAFFCVLYILFGNGNGGDKVNIYADGSLYKSVKTAPSDAEAFTVEIETENGHNTVIIGKSYAAMQSADCPDKLCVKQGKIHGKSEPIVCLPHKVVVSFSADDEINAVSQ